MKEKEAQEIIKDLPIGSKLQVVKKNGDIIEVVLASHDTQAIEKKSYDELEVPKLPPAIIVQGARWGTFRMELEEISNIAQIG